MSNWGCYSQLIVPVLVFGGVGLVLLGSVTSDWVIWAGVVAIMIVGIPMLALFTLMVGGIFVVRLALIVYAILAVVAAPFLWACRHLRP